MTLLDGLDRDFSNERISVLVSDKLFEYACVLLAIPFRLELRCDRHHRHRHTGLEFHLRDDRPDVEPDKCLPSITALLACRHAEAIERRADVEEPFPRLCC